MKQFYKDNTEYFWMLIVSLLLIIMSNYLLIKFGYSEWGLFVKLNENKKELDETAQWNAIGKIWEIACCGLTLIFNFWFWYLKKSKTGEPKSGKEIIGLVSDNTTKLLLHFVIGLSIFIITVAIAFNIGLIFDGSIFAGKICVAITAFLFIIFSIVDFLTIKVLKKLKTDGTDVETEISDFNSALKNSDIPILVAFIVLSIYALFTYSGMELFFSGAIGFQLLYSTVIWANLKSV